MLKMMKECNIIKFAGYRTAAKLRVLQRVVHSKYTIYFYILSLVVLYKNSIVIMGKFICTVFILSSQKCVFLL